MTYAKVLSSIEEIAVLNALSQAYEEDGFETYGGGSSRLVYILKDKPMRDLCILLGIPFQEYVIKVALGVGGKNQTDNEISAWNTCHDYLPLAPISAYGKFVEIMERVTPFEDDDTNEGFDMDEERAWNAASEWEFAFWSYYYGWYVDALTDGDTNDVDADAIVKRMTEEDEFRSAVIVARDYAYDKGWLTKEEYQKSINMSVEMLNSYLDLCGEFGDTTDNNQLGRNMNSGNIECYDYGFRGNHWGSTHTWSSGIGDWHSDLEFELYFQDLKMLILNPSKNSIEDIENNWEHSEKTDEFVAETW